VRVESVQRIAGIAVLLFLITSLQQQAQAQAAPHSRPKASQAAAMSVNDVIRLAKAGVSEDIILEQIKKNGKAFDLTTDQLIQLKSAQVSDRIVQCMLDPSRMDPSRMDESSTSFASIPAPAPPASASAPISKAPLLKPAIPAEPGVYVKSESQWLEVLPEIAHWKTGGVLKSFATAGIVHGDLNGHLNGAVSSNSYSVPVDFLIVLPEGTAITEYQLLRLKANKDNREFRTVTGGVMHSQEGSTRDAVTFNPEKISAHAFVVHFSTDLGVGEYAFLPPGSAGASGKIYSFHATGAASTAVSGGAASTAQATVAPSFTPVALSAPASSASQTGWTTHNDPAGFFIAFPAGWKIATDKARGHIVVSGLHGEQVTVWPTFVEQRQLDESSANELVLQLARKVDDKLSWTAATPAGKAIRVVAHSGPTYGATLMTWNNTSTGASVCIFSVEAPAETYSSSAETFAGILKSFRVVPGPASNAAAVPAISSVSYIKFTDPREHAFSMDVPRGWRVVGGAYRLTTTDIRNNVTVMSPDGAVRVFFGDTHFGAFTAPNRMMSSVGMREGSTETISDGSKIEVHAYMTGEQFAHAYVQKYIRPQCSDLNVESHQMRQDLAAQFTQKASTEGVTGARMTAGDVTFTCNLHGSQMRGYVAVATAGKSQGPTSIRFAYRLYGYIAAPESEPVAQKVTQQMLDSWRLDLGWLSHEMQMANAEVAQGRAQSQQFQAQTMQAIHQDQQETSDLIVKGYEQRSQVYDNISRQRENAILGQVDVVDPSSGTQYKVDNYSNYHWMNNQGYVAGTGTDSSPGSDWRELVEQP
jgi:hypothetical protein